VADCGVRRFPELLKTIVSEPRVSWRDGCALDCHFDVFYGSKSIESNLVSGGVTVLNAEIVFVETQINKGKNQL